MDFSIMLNIWSTKSAQESRNFEKKLSLLTRFWWIFLTLCNPGCLHPRPTRQQFSVTKSSPSRSPQTRLINSTPLQCWGVGGTRPAIFHGRSEFLCLTLHFLSPFQAPFIHIYRPSLCLWIIARERASVCMWVVIASVCVPGDKGECAPGKNCRRGCRWMLWD